MKNISLTSAMSMNLLSLKQTSSTMSEVQNRLATGLKVNSAIDNPSAYYTAVSLNNRASDLNALLDNMGQAIQTVKAAVEGVTSATAFLEQMSSIAEQAISEPITIIDNIYRKEELFNGKANTQAILDQIGADGLAASAANQFYVGSKTDENFGQGKWYLPAIGELMDVFGYNVEEMMKGNDESGATGENKILINSALSVLNGKGIEAETLAADYYWSSTESSNDNSWLINIPIGKRGRNGKSTYSLHIRSFNQVENINIINGTAPKIGDVMYSDLSYGSADDYDKNKTAVGVVTWVSEDGKSAKIMNLKDLTFSSTSTENNFDPDNPYGGRQKKSLWATKEKFDEDISGISNYTPSALLNVMKFGEMIETTTEISSQWSSEYNTILRQYDMLINDASYKGINLLKGDALNVIFNENKSSRLNITGRDISSSALGLSAADWKTTADVSASISDLRRTIAALRSLSGELGNNYSVVQSRQDFTENLINILTEGADKLTLADMNEESAVMLSLQTRQQLAINSLSLASQAGQSVLRLFA